MGGASEQKVGEFFAQKEMEGFGPEPLGFRGATFDRLHKLDTDGKLAAAETELLPGMIDTSAQATRLKSHNELVTKIAVGEKELVSAKALIVSFENAEYRTINTELGELSKELQGLRHWRS